jgi:hypothetical protein
MFVARNPFNVASDWAGSCVIVIKRRRERGEMPEMNFLTLRGKASNREVHEEGLAQVIVEASPIIQVPKKGKSNAANDTIHEPR